MLIRSLPMRRSPLSAITSNLNYYTIKNIDFEMEDGVKLHLVVPPPDQEVQDFPKFDSRASDVVDSNLCENVVRFDSEIRL